MLERIGSELKPESFPLERYTLAYRDRQVPRRGMQPKGFSKDQTLLGAAKVSSHLRRRQDGAFCLQEAIWAEQWA